MKSPPSILKFQVGDFISASYEPGTIWKVVKVGNVGPYEPNPSGYHVRLWGIEDPRRLPDSLFSGAIRKYPMVNDGVPKLDNFIWRDLAIAPNEMLILALSAKYSEEDRENLRRDGYKQMREVYPDHYESGDFVIYRQSVWAPHLKWCFQVISNYRNDLSGEKRYVLRRIDPIFSGETNSGHDSLRIAPQEVLDQIPAELLDAAKT